MIARISGKIVEARGNRIFMSCGDLCYEVLVPANLAGRLASQAAADASVSLVTYHYLHVEQSRALPVLIGFLSEIEKEFFEVFITVSGIGPRAALRALTEPVPLIAKAIDEGDVNFLRSLPGIGPQRAREIVAKLQHKVGKFGLMRDESQAAPVPEPALDIKEEALAVLQQLQYSKAEAESMIKKAIARAPEIESTEALLNEVYKQKRLQ